MVTKKNKINSEDYILDEDEMIEEFSNIIKKLKDVGRDIKEIQKKYKYLKNDRDMILKRKRNGQQITKKIIEKLRKN